MELITGRRRQLHCSTAEEARIIAKSADPDANISAVAWNNGDKYPLAKPGTLECEPFKAAEKPATRPTHWSIRRFRAAGKLPRRCVAPSPSLDLELRAREVHNTKRRNATYVPAHPEKCTGRKCQTATATPAEPGGNSHFVLAEGFLRYGSGRRAKRRDGRWRSAVRHGADDER